MSKRDELAAEVAALTETIRELREEVAALRAHAGGCCTHVCWHYHAWPGYVRPSPTVTWGAAPAVTAGTVYSVNTG